MVQFALNVVLDTSRFVATTEIHNIQVVHMQVALDYHTTSVCRNVDYQIVICERAYLLNGRQQH